MNDDDGALFRHVGAALASYARAMPRGRVVPPSDAADARALARGFDFDAPTAAKDAVDRVIAALAAHGAQAGHPGHFGHFNQAPSDVAVAAEAIAAAINPQLAAHAASPFAVEAEAHVVRSFAVKMGISSHDADGVACSGGAEANLTALALAVHRAFPSAAEEGLGAIGARPAIYVTRETHGSIAKAARVAGVGARALRPVATDAGGRMIARALAAALEGDRAAGLTPALVVATCGATSSGAVDPIDDIADVCARQDVWLHADAAWGGAFALAPTVAPRLGTLARADSITLDPHKFLGIPTGAGMLLTRHRGALDATFAARGAYMPAAKDDAPDPYARGLQWSRRFAGLKVLMTLATRGWDGCARALDRQAALGDALKRSLVERDFPVTNDTPLPLACFVDGRRQDGRDAAYLAKVARVVCAGKSWIAPTRWGDDGAPALRACIAGEATTEADIERLMGALMHARVTL